MGKLGRFRSFTRQVFRDYLRQKFSCFTRSRQVVLPLINPIQPTITPTLPILPIVTWQILDCRHLPHVVSSTKSNSSNLSNRLDNGAEDRASNLRRIPKCCSQMRGARYLADAPGSSIGHSQAGSLGHCWKPRPLLDIDAATILGSRASRWFRLGCRIEREVSRSRRRGRR